MNNITFDSLLTLFSGKSLITFFIKSFSIVFSLVYMTYAIVVYKQTQEISQAVQNERNRFIVFITFVQIWIGLFLLLFAIFFV